LVPCAAVHGFRVAVAGTGLAGLSAACELARAGAAVTLLDARSYVGGRVRTIRAFSAQQHGELGGEFIDGDQKEIIDLCRRFDLPLVRILRSGFTHRFRDSSGMYHASRTAPWEALHDCLSPLLRRYKLARGDSSSDVIRELATMSLSDWMRQSNAPPEVHTMANALRAFFLADPDEISILPVVEQLAKGGAPSQTEFYRIEGGNDRLVEALLRAAGGRVLPGHSIRALANALNRVVITVTDPSGLTQQIEADYVVMTLPASTLRHVDIQPPLPEDQRRAIERLAYGRATKVLLQSSRKLFDGRHARAFATDGCLGAFWDASEEQGDDASIASFLAGGSASACLLDKAAGGGQAVLSDLCWLGIDRSPVIAEHVGDWTADPWVRGGYAFLDPGFDPSWRPLLARRAGRIVFAGEHTSERWQGYMNGAVESGQRAARELLHDLGH
jgi:monoamine oxidase